MDVDDQQDDNDSIHDIIDPNEFFAGAEDGGGVQDQREEQLAVVGPGVPVDDIDAQIEQCYQSTVKPLIDLWHQDPVQRTAYKLVPDPLYILAITDAKTWLLLAKRQDYRQEFIDAFQHEGRRAESQLERAMIYWNRNLFQGMEAPWDDLRTCVSELGSALAEITKLNHVTIALWYHDNHEIMDSIAGIMLQRLQQRVETLHFKCVRRQGEPMPDPFVRAICDLPRLQKLTLTTVPSGTIVGLVCGSVAGHQSLKTLELKCRDPITLDSNVALAMDRMLRANTLAHFSIYNARFANNAVSEAICESIMASHGLERLGLGRLHFHYDEVEESEALFFRRLGHALPTLTNLVDLGISWDRDRVEIPSHDDFLQALLAGVASLPMIHSLYLGNFAWTPGVTQAMANCLLSCKSLRFLSMYSTSISRNNDNVLSLLELTQALETSSLQTFRCELDGFVGAAIVEIAKALGRNQVVQHVELQSRSSVPIDTPSEIFASFHNSVSLKGLHLRLHSSCCEVSDAEFVNLLTAIEGNVGVEKIDFSPWTWQFDERGRIVKNCIDTICELNRLGRRYIRAPNAPDFGQRAVQVLGGTDHLDSLYMHLHEIPALFRRRNDDDE